MKSPLFFIFALLVSSSGVPLECDHIVENVLPCGTPSYKQVAFVNATCSAWHRPADFCRKIAQGASFFDFNLDFRKLPLGICANTKTWVIENLYIVKV
jgi:hypothetical protein